jgi:hypothetical protein
MRLPQYVIMLPTAEAGSSLRDLLAMYPAINILQDLDSQTALVEMPDAVAQTLAADHPEVIIERNIRYAMLDAR